uniref:Uncharacterized protein n=1 Tax=Anopheles quadriannulatus TaxID=34691 RepID=A0A182XRK0_ANOQN
MIFCYVFQMESLAEQNTWCGKRVCTKVSTVSEPNVNVRLALYVNYTTVHEATDYSVRDKKQRVHVDGVIKLQSIRSSRYEEFRLYW